MTMEGSSSSNMDEKKQRRMEANRVSARKSRIKKQQLVEDLKKEMLEKDLLISMLNARIMGLEDQVRTRDFLLQTLKEVTGVALDSASIRDPSFEIPHNVFREAPSGH